MAAKSGFYELLPIKESQLMNDAERIKLLEKALIKYVELYGFIDEAREYYIHNMEVKMPPPERKH